MITPQPMLLVVNTPLGRVKNVVLNKWGKFLSYQGGQIKIFYGNFAAQLNNAMIQVFPWSNSSIAQPIVSRPLMS